MRPERERADNRFLRLLIAHQDTIHAFIFAIVHNSADADDIFQETVTVMWRKFENFEPGTDFASWGVSVAKWCTLRFLSKKSKSRLKFCSHNLQAIEDCIVRKVRQMDARKSALESCVKKLPEKQQKILAMRYKQGLKTCEIGDIFNYPRHKTYRILGKIHDTLEKCINRTLSEEEAVR